MAIKAGGITKRVITATAILDDRELLEKILDITNEEVSFLDIMELTGASVVTTQPEYSNIVNEELYIQGVAGSSPAAANQVDVTIDATSYAAVVVGELALVPNAGTPAVARVQEKKAANVITLKNVEDNTATLTIVATDQISFISNAQAEGSSAPEGKSWGQAKYTNQVQIFKNSYNITDVQKASTIEVEIDGQPYIFNKLGHDSLVKYRADIGFATFFSRKSAANFGSAAPSLVDANGKPIQTTMGVDQYTTTYGVNRPAVAAVNLAEVAALNKVLNTNRAPLEYQLYVGTEMNIDYDDMLNALGTNAISSAARFTIEGKNIELGIDSFKLYGRTFHKKYLPLLDHKNVAALYGKSAYAVPFGKVKAIDGGMVDYMRMRYMAGDGYDGRYRELHLGGLAPQPTDSRSIHEVVFESIQGLEILGAQHLIKQTLS
jgi:hypothetical protein